MKGQGMNPVITATGITLAIVVITYLTYKLVSWMTSKHFGLFLFLIAISYIAMTWYIVYTAITI